MDSRQRGLALLIAGLLVWGAAIAEPSPLADPQLVLTPLGGARTAIEARQLQGKVVYVDFWASWCVPCRASFPWLEELHRKHQARGLVILGINKDQEPGGADKFLARYPVSFPLLQDPGDKLAKGFAVRGMPSAYLIDRRGNIRHTHVGFRQESTAELERMLVELLKENAT
ncbi:MAG: TlpA disulfide reductase family protein [Sulfurisoma sp.]|nr:TlpA disulfide reductase family protein [Sulfurisoma sp.]